MSHTVDAIAHQTLTTLWRLPNLESASALKQAVQYRYCRHALCAFLEEDQQYQTITFQPLYEDYSLEELRVTDYDRARRTGNTVVEGGLFGKNIGPDNDLFSENDPVSDNHPESESNDDSEQNDDSELDNDSKPKTSSDNRARKNTIKSLDSRPFSGDRLVDLPTLERIIRGLKLSKERQMRKIAVPFRNPDNTYSVTVWGSLLLLLHSRLLTDGETMTIRD
jgi:hypothetical protein